MEKDLAQFTAQGAQLIAIAAQDETEAQATLEETKVSYPILADSDHAVSAAYGVFDTLGDGVATPSVFVIDQDGAIVWSYIGKNANDRPDNQTILAHLPAE